MKKIENIPQEPIIYEPPKEATDQSLAKKSEGGNGRKKKRLESESGGRDRSGKEGKDKDDMMGAKETIEEAYSTTEKPPVVSSGEKRNEEDKSGDKDEYEKVEPDPEVERYLPEKAGEYKESCEKLSRVRLLLRGVEDQLTSGRKKLRNHYIKEEDLLTRKIEKLEREARRRKKDYLNSPKFYEDKLKKEKERLKVIEEGWKEGGEQQKLIKK